MKIILKKNPKQQNQQRSVRLAKFIQTAAFHIVYSLLCPCQYQEVPLWQMKKIKGVY